MGSEVNRKHPRYGISTEVRIRYGGRDITATTIDISSSGIGVESSADIRPDTPGTVTIGIPEEVTLYCTAAWSLRTPLEKGNEHRIGFAIDGSMHEGSVHHGLAAINRVIEKIVSKFG